MEIGWKKEEKGNRVRRGTEKNAGGITQLDGL